jgi:site-specific DNA-methyltransferase (adenine-specific)
MPLKPGDIRDSILSYLATFPGDASVSDISDAVAIQIGAVSASSIRSYLNLNVPTVFERTARGRYRLNRGVPDEPKHMVAYGLRAGAGLRQGQAAPSRLL